MSLVPSPSQTDIQTALRGFLTGILPSGVEVIVGQESRLPEPPEGDFVVFTPIRRERLATNLDTFNDCAFVGSISGTVLAVTQINLGAITIGNLLFGTAVPLGTTIVAQPSGTPGGVGTYTVSPPQSISSQLMACGVQNDMQPTKVTFQLDVHGPNSDDNAQIISTLIRDDYATWNGLEENGIFALYADDPKQVPFVNAENQYENRYVIEACLQCNQIVAPSTQYFDHITITPVEAD